MQPSNAVTVFSEFRIHESAINPTQYGLILSPTECSTKKNSEIAVARILGCTMSKNMLIPVSQLILNESVSGMDTKIVRYTFISIVIKYMYRKNAERKNPNDKR